MQVRRQNPFLTEFLEFELYFFFQFVQLLSLIPTLILLLYLLVSIDLVYTGLYESTSQKKNNCILNFFFFKKAETMHHKVTLMGKN